MVAEETALQRFEGTAEDDHAAVEGEQRALARLEQVADDARDFAAHAKAPNTLKAYRIDWADFSEWCALHRLEDHVGQLRPAVLLKEVAGAYMEY